MPLPFRSLLFLALGLSLVTASTAEARFGKRSNSDESRSQSSSRDDDEGGDDDRGSYHEATSGDSKDGYSRPASSSSRRSRPYYSFWRSRPRCIDYGCAGLMWTGYGYYPLSGAPLPDDAPTASGPRRIHERPLVVTVGADVQVFRGGATGGLNALFEGKRWGFGLEYQGIAVGADDGTDMVDTIGLFATDLSYAVLASPHGRLRFEAGLNIASAPDVTFVGPRIGVSGAVALLGPINAEGAIRYTPFPHGQIDAFGGFALAFGHLGLRAGYKQIYLDDRGLLDGERHTDLFSGPYFGAALSL